MKKKFFNMIFLFFMNKKMYALFVCLLLSLSCKENENSKENILKSFLGKKFEFVNIKCCKYGDFKLDSRYKMILYIDSAECTSCALENNLLLWQNYKSQLNDFKIDLIIILNTSEEDKVKDFFELITTDYPIFLDNRGVLKKQNSLLQYIENKTFMVDNANRLVWIGSPIQNEKSWLIFQKMMQQVKNN